MTGPLTKDQFSYTQHLQLDTLQKVMQPITGHPEERLFLTVHHALEIWFKQVIFDLGRTIEILSDDRVPEANWLLKRMAEILRLSESHWTVLETMSAADFHEFRPHLTGASGMQSRQFREVEVMCGLHEIAEPTYRRGVEERWPGMIEAHPTTLRAAFFSVIERSQLSLVEIHRDRWQHSDLFFLAENVFEFDRRFQAWRFSHILMVRRQIGMRTKGTGGTFGRDYLASTLNYLFFPELWELRHEIAELHGAEVAASKGGTLER